jgi:hypothetical protein
MPVTAVSTLCLPAGDGPVALGPLLEEATGGQRFRRINRLIERALIGAQRCRHQDEVTWAEGQQIVIGSGQGNIADPTARLESVVGRGQPPMPFQFINLAGNMAGFYLAQSLGAESANTTVSQLEFPVEAALQVAAEEHYRFGSVLVGAVDELAWPLEDHRVRLGCQGDAVVGEGSHWLRIGSDAPPLGWLEPPVYLEGDRALERCLDAAAVTAVVHTPSTSPRHPVHDTMAAAVLCEFLAQGQPGEVLAHVSGDGRGRHAVVVARRQ